MRANKKAEVLASALGYKFKKVGGFYFLSGKGCGLSCKQSITYHNLVIMVKNLEKEVESLKQKRRNKV